MTTTRRSALALAGAVAGTLTAASLAGAVNLGLLSTDSTSANEPIQLLESDSLEPTVDSTTTTVVDGVEVVIEDVYDLPAVVSPAGDAPSIDAYDDRDGYDERDAVRDVDDDRDSDEVGDEDERDEDDDRDEAHDDDGSDDDD